MKIPKTEERKIPELSIARNMQLDEIRQENSHIYNLRQTFLLNNF